MGTAGVLRVNVRASVLHRGEFGTSRPNMGSGGTVSVGDCRSSRIVHSRKKRSERQRFCRAMRTWVHIARLARGSFSLRKAALRSAAAVDQMVKSCNEKK